MGIVGTAAEKPDSPKVSGNLNQRSYTRTFIVKTDSKDTGPLAVVSASGIPRLYEPFAFGSEVDPECLLRDIDAERVSEGAFQWVVTCHYSTPEPDSKNASSTDTAGTKREAPGSQDNPQLQLPEIDVSFEKFQQVVYAVYDITTQELTPCKASNDQVFDPPPMRDASRMVIQIVRNEPISAGHPALGVLYQDAVNSDYWFGLAPGQAKIMSIAAQRQTKQTTIAGAPVLLPYLRCTYKIECRPTWDTLILDAGTFYLDDDPLTGKVKKKAFITDDGHPTTGPLDGHGHKLDAGANPVFKTFRFYLRRPFSLLALPQSFLDFA